MSRKKSALERITARARLWDRQGRWDEEALALNTKILKKAPDRVGAYVRRGRCYLEMGRIEEAERDFRIALDKDPQNREASELLRRTEDLTDASPGESWIHELVNTVLRRFEDGRKNENPTPPVNLPDLPISQYTGSGAHSVYVVELDPDVLERSKFRAENPGYVPGRPCVYVGLTGLTPEERFHNHRVGYKASRYVRDFGLRLMPELYEHLNPLPFEEAEHMEDELAQALREAGYAVWSF